MTASCNISVIIVSHDRPEYLRKMLACLRLQDVLGFQTIVVTNTPNAVIPATGLLVIPFEQPNIAIARNIGIEAARGAFIAFCDDDALPDPGWLQKLMQPFDDPQVGGAAGFTRGSNGISRQWGAVLTDDFANENRVTLTETTVFDPDPKTSPVMIGTNCAFRTSALLHIGGFDPAFAYYLDDSDISLRLSKSGWKQVILPNAQVHHSFAPSAQRSHHAVPKSLKPLGRSKAYFCRKHASARNAADILKAFKKAQHQRVEKMFLLGQLEAAKFKELMQSLDDGYIEGAALPLTKTVPQPWPTSTETPVFDLNKAKHIVLATRKVNESIQNIISDLCKNGHRVTLLELSYSAMFMQVGFSNNGFWHHKGGQFGKIERSDPLWHKASFKEKTLSECQRLAKMRPIDLLTFFEPGQFDASLLPQTFGMSSLNGYRVLDDSLLWLETGT